MFVDFYDLKKGNIDKNTCRDYDFLEFKKIKRNQLHFDGEFFVHDDDNSYDVDTFFQDLLPTLKKKKKNNYHFIR